MEYKYSNEEQFRAEKLYYISRSIAKSMLEKGIIDREVFTIIDTKLLEKYRPISGTFFVTVFNEEDVRFTFKDGTEIRA